MKFFWVLPVLSFAVFAATYIYPEQSFKIVLRPELYLSPTSAIVPFNLQIFAVRVITFWGFVPYFTLKFKDWLFRQSRTNFTCISLAITEACFLWFEFVLFFGGGSIPGFPGVASRIFYEGFVGPAIFALPNLAIPTLIVMTRLGMLKT